MRASVTICAVVLFISLGAVAQEVYVPAGANAEGAAGTRWRTDLEVKARGAEAATFTVELLEAGVDNSDPMSAEFAVAAGRSLRLRDVVGDVFEVTGSGALRVTPTSGRILVTSRTYNDDAAGTYGQFVAAYAAEDATPFAAVASVIQLSRSATPTSGYRTNVGLVNLTAGDISIEVDLYDALGTLLGTVERSLLPYEYHQLNDVFALVDATDVEDGYAMVRTTTAEGSFLTYASVVDNGSGDAVFIPGQSDDPPEGEVSRLVVFETFMRDG